MSDEDLESNTPEVEKPKNKMEELPDWAKEEIASLRRESAGRRVSNNELSKELEEFRQWKDQQKTDFEKALERATKAEADLAVLRRERLQAKAAKEAGLDPDLADRIRGESEDEMLEDAKALVEKAGKFIPEADQAAMFGSGGVQPIRTSGNTNDQFKAWINAQ